MDNEYVDELKNELKDDEFTCIYPKDYALKLREKFKESPSLWYDVIIPKSKATEFKKILKMITQKFGMRIAIAVGKI